MYLKNSIQVILLLLGSHWLWAHGVSHTIFRDGIGIQVFYDNGSPFSYSEVIIYSPADKKVEFQTGITDKNGRFIFSPDETGVWVIKIDDGMGHGLVKKIEIASNQLVESLSPVLFPLWEKILIGVSLIVGITGFLYGITIKNQFVK